MYFCTRTYITVLEYIFSNSNIYFCSVKSFVPEEKDISVLEYILLYWNIYRCIGIYIVVLGYVLLYWNIQCCTAPVGHRKIAYPNSIYCCYYNM